MACTETPLWVQFLTPSIAASVAIIAYRQYVTAREKLRLDLYDRRFRLYQVAMKYLESVMNKKPWRIHRDEFIMVYRESKFLFDAKDGLYSLMEEIDTVCLNAACYRRNATNTVPHQDKSYVDEQYTINMANTNKLLPLLETLESKLQPYIAFNRHISMFERCKGWTKWGNKNS